MSKKCLLSQAICFLLLLLSFMWFVLFHQIPKHFITDSILRMSHISKSTFHQRYHFIFIRWSIDRLNWIARCTSSFSWMRFTSFLYEIKKVFFYSVNCRSKFFNLVGWFWFLIILLGEHLILNFDLGKHIYFVFHWMWSCGLT